MLRSVAMFVCLFCLPSSAMADPTGPWIALRHGAWLSTPDGQQAQLLTGSRYPFAPLRARWISQDGDVVRFTSPAQSTAAHCLQPGPLQSVWRVELLVSVDDLVTVTAAPVDLSLADGGRLHIEAGVPIDERGQAQIGGAVPAQTVPLPARATRWSSPGSSTSPQAGADERLVILSDRCATAVVVDAEPAPDTADRVSVGRVPPVHSGAQIQFHAGAALRWPDGSHAGELLEARRFYVSHVRAVGDMACARVPVGSTFGDAPPASSASIELCTANTSVSPVEGVAPIVRR